MAKKKKPARTRPAGKNKAPKAAKPKRVVPRQRALPGTEQIRSKTLDRLCESIGSAREERNRLVQEEAGDSQAALKEMLAKGYHTYVQMGVRLTCKKGVDKLGITLVKDKSEIGSESAGAEMEAAEPAFAEAGDSGLDGEV